MPRPYQPIIHYIQSRNDEWSRRLEAILRNEQRDRTNKVRRALVRSSNWQWHLIRDFIRQCSFEQVIMLGNGDPEWVRLKLLFSEYDPQQMSLEVNEQFAMIQDELLRAYGRIGMAGNERRQDQLHISQQFVRLAHYKRLRAVLQDISTSLVLRTAGAQAFYLDPADSQDFRQEMIAVTALCDSVIGRVATNGVPENGSFSNVLYEDNAVSALIKQAFTGMENITVTSSHITGQEEYHADDYQANQMHLIFPRNPEDHKRTVIPVNIAGAHWVLLYADYQNGDLQVYVMDPLQGDKRSRSAVKRAIKRDLVQALDQYNNRVDVTITHNSLHPQHANDAVNCGPWIVAMAEHLKVYVQALENQAGRRVHQLPQRSGRERGWQSHVIGPLIGQDINFLRTTQLDNIVAKVAELTAQEPPPGYDRRPHVNDRPPSPPPAYNRVGVSCLDVYRTVCRYPGTVHLPLHRAMYPAALDLSVRDLFHSREFARQEYAVPIMPEGLVREISANRVASALRAEFTQTVSREVQLANQHVAADRYGGIGAYIDYDADGRIIVTRVMRGLPADQAGLQVGQEIRYINRNGQAVPFADLGQAMDYIRGVGNIVTLAVWSEEGGFIRCDISRDFIDRRREAKHRYSTDEERQFIANCYQQERGVQQGQGMQQEPQAPLTNIDSASYRGGNINTLPNYDTNVTF